MYDVAGHARCMDARAAVYGARYVYYILYTSRTMHSSTAVRSRCGGQFRRAAGRVGTARDSPLPCRVPAASTAAVSPRAGGAGELRGTRGVQGTARKHVSVIDGGKEPRRAA